MWSFRPFARTLLIALALSAAAAVSGCTGLRPVYQQPSPGVARTAFFYGAPVSRLDQVIYAELRLRLGPHSAAPGAVRVTVSASSSARALTKTAVVRPSQQFEAMVVANVSVIRADGTVAFSGQRRATAAYQYIGQVLADNAAAVEATERAARSLAETVRLTILSALER